MLFELHHDYRVGLPPGCAHARIGFVHAWRCRVGFAQNARLNAFACAMFIAHLKSGSSHRAIAESNRTGEHKDHHPWLNLQFGEHLLLAARTGLAARPSVR